MDAKLRAARQDFKQRERIAKVRTEMLADFRVGLVAREKALTQNIVSEFHTWLTDVDSLPANEQPVGWNSTEARAAFTRVGQRAAAVARSWNKADEMHRHLDGLDAEMSRFFRAVGVEQQPARTLRPAEAVDALARQMAKLIAKDCIAVAEEYARADDEFDTDAAFGFPPDDAPVAQRTRRRARDFAKEEAAIDAQTEAAVRSLKSDAERAYVRRLIEHIVGDVSKLPGSLGAFARTRAKSVVLGTLWMFLAGGLIYVGGVLATRVLVQGHEAIAKGVSAVDAGVGDAAKGVAEMQEELSGLTGQVDAVAEAVRASADAFKELSTDLPANEQGLAAMGVMLDRLRKASIARMLEKNRSMTQEHAAELFDSLLTGVYSSFSELRDAYKSGKDIGIGFSDFRVALDSIFNATETKLTLEAIDVIRNSLLAFRQLLERTGKTLADLVGEARKLREAHATVLAEEAIYLTKAPFSAYIMKKIGEACGGTAKFGSMVFAQSTELMKLQEMESYVRVLTGGVDELLVDGISGLFTNAIFLGMVSKTSAVVSFVSTNLLRAGAAAVRMGRRVGAFVAAFRSPDQKPPAGASAPGFWAKVEDFLTARANEIDEANGFWMTFAHGLSLVGNLVSIVKSVCTLIWMLLSWGTAWYIGTTVVAGIAIYLIIKKALAISPSAVAAYVCRQLIGYHWILAPALYILVQALSVNQGAPAPSATGDTWDPLEPEQTKRWEQIAEIANKRELNASLQEATVSASATELDSARAGLSTGTAWYMSTS